MLLLHQGDALEFVPINLFRHRGKSQEHRCSQPQRSDVINVHKEITDRVQEEAESVREADRALPQSGRACYAGTSG